MFLASDQIALHKVAQKFIYLEEGDIAEIQYDHLIIYNLVGKIVTRTFNTRKFKFEDSKKGQYRYFMRKEIFEQPKAVSATLLGRVCHDHVIEQAFGRAAKEIFDQTKHVQIVACGTSYFAGLIAKYWLEELAGISCQVDVASEFRYRKRVIPADSLFVTISQSGETADTLAALRSTTLDGPKTYCGSLTICNVPESTLVRESQLIFLTHAGPEISVASTKSFITQLTGLLLLTLILGRRRNLRNEQIVQHLKNLSQLPEYLSQILAMEHQIQKISSLFKDKQHTLFLGRGVHFPVALEGALKLKEISYIHAEAYPAGELKHGPLALVDKHMPVVILAPPDAISHKINSNIEEVSSRGGQLIIFSNQETISEQPGILKYLALPEIPELLTPFIYTIPLQLLAYHVAVNRGTDIDHPRNLAKSVTV